MIKLPGKLKLPSKLIISFVLISAIVLFLFGCAKPIKEINKPNRSRAAGFVGLVLDFIITAELWGLIPKTRIKNDQFIGEEVTVKGSVEKTLKIGSLSEYTLVDKNGDKIIVTSASLPPEGTKKRVTGTLRKMLLIGYYIEEKP
ncbi:MAG: hypothetical protein AB1668_01230 [Nanoarchaeota archaeon]